MSKSKPRFWAEFHTYQSSGEVLGFPDAGHTLKPGDEVIVFFEEKDDDWDGVVTSADERHAWVQLGWESE